MNKPYYKLKKNDKGQEVVEFYNIPDEIPYGQKNYVDYLHIHNPEEYEKLTSHMVKTSRLQEKKW